MKPIEIHEYLSREIPLFKELTAEEMMQIVEISKGDHYKKNSYVFRKDEPLDKVFFIKSGRIKISRTDMSGKEQIFALLEDGDMFPHAGFFRKGTYPADAEVIEDSILIVTSITDFENILINKPALSIKMFRILGDKIVDLQDRLEDQILHNTYEQIIKLFIRLAGVNGVSQGETIRLTSRYATRDLANMIGTSRETLSRTINQLKKKDCIALDDDNYYIINVERLNAEFY